MRLDRVLSFGLLAFAAVAVLATLIPFTPASRTEADEPGSPHPERMVVVELFTSQGCSSCPPADRLLRRLGSDPQLDGWVVPLSFHVDYWNRLGWRDPFSSPQWTERQERYVRALRARSLYTPQMVVNGEREMVGSSENRVRDAIRRSLAEPPVGSVEVEAGRPDGGALPVSVSAELEDGPPHDLMLALFEIGLETDVRRGENAGRHLANDYVVRRLTRVAGLDAGTPRVEESVRIPVEPEWGGGELGVAAFLQHPTRLTIGAAAVGRARQ